MVHIKKKNFFFNEVKWNKQRDRMARVCPVTLAFSFHL